MNPLSLTARLYFVCFIATLSASAAYRIGDAVGILLRTSHNSHLEAYRHQMPRFGISTKARFDISSLEDTATAESEHHDLDRWNRVDPNNKEPIRLSISFDEGFHHIPWMDVYNKHHQLETLVITFVYSESDGSIHAVHRETKYVEGLAKLLKSFTVEYVWIEEADVDMQRGVLVLFLCVIIFVLIGMVGECSASESRRRRERGKERSFLSSSGSEGFTKRL